MERWQRVGMLRESGEDEEKTGRLEKEMGGKEKADERRVRRERMGEVEERQIRWKRWERMGSREKE